MILARMRVLLLLTGTLLTLLLGLGLRLQWQGRAQQGQTQHRHAQQKRGRWLHHLLFFAVTALTVLATALQARKQQPYWPLLIPDILLLSMPLTTAGRSNHWQLALVCALGYGWAAWQVW